MGEKIACLSSYEAQVLEQVKLGKDKSPYLKNKKII
jgi:hypothetical protein